MNGVVAYLRSDGNDNLCLVMDDAEATSPSENLEWKSTALFTTKNFSLESLIDLALTKEEFAQIGEDIIIRLLALRGDIK